MSENNVITEFKGEYHFLSNFYQCDFVYEGLTYHTAEAAFQAQKCSSEEDEACFYRTRVDRLILILFDEFT